MQGFTPAPPHGSQLQTGGIGDYTQRAAPAFSRKGIGAVMPDSSVSGAHSIPMSHRELLDKGGHKTFTLFEHVVHQATSFLNLHEGF